MKSIFLFTLVLFSCAAVVRAQAIYELPEGVETRWASPENPTGEKGRAGTALGGRKGSPTIALKAGESVVLAEAKNTSGTVRRIWMTMPDRRPQMLRGLRLEMFWDGAASPAVSAPVGDFFGVSLGQMAQFESAFFSNPEGRSLNCFVPMPFRTGMRIVMRNESGRDLPELFYDVDYTLGDRHAASTLYFHAHWRRENPTTLRRDYEILPKVSGRGRYLGTNVGVIVNQSEYFNTWWGEGEVKIYLDGDAELPTLAGTGTEDYIGTAWGQGRYSNLYQGSPVADEARMRWCFYRYHVVEATSIEKDPNKRKGAGAPFQIRRGKKWGYMDKAGKVIIEPQFDAEGDFFHGLARVAKVNKWGYINEKGEESIPFRFDDARDFTGEIAPVRVGRKWGYIDLSGRWVVSPQFQAAGEIFEGLSRVVFWNRMECAGSRVYTSENAPEYLYVLPDMIMGLTTGCFPVDARYGVLDQTGKFVIQPHLDRLEDFSEGLAAFHNGDKVGYIDVKGNVVIAPKFDYGENFSEGLAQAGLNSKSGYIDKSGNWVIQPSFLYGGVFSEDLARIRPVTGNYMGYIDKTGRMVIQPQYEEAWDFSEGLAPVWKDDQWRYIDRSGKTVLQFDKARWGFSDGLTIVGEYPDRVYVDKTGRVVAQYEVGSQF